MRNYHLLPLGLAVGLLSETATALDIRGYMPARHDRFIGFPSTPVPNGDAWFDAASHAGVGWLVSDPRRQFVLISPRHFLLSTHWGLGAGESVRFLGADGQLHTYIVESTTQITENGAGTDLSLGRFTEAVDPATGVSPMPYLNLASDSAYVGSALQVFGFDARVGAGTLAGFSRIDIGTGSTRMYRFDYSFAGGSEDDSHFAVGDSNSPSFVLVNGKPALTGLHSAMANLGTAISNYDAFVPYYAPQIDALLAADGWRMTPAVQAATQLAVTATTSPSPLKQALAGSVAFAVKNTTSSPDGNLLVTLEFPEGAAPDSVTGTGWVAVESGPLVWSFRRGSLAAASSATLTANWAVVPSVTAFETFATTLSDGSASQTTTLTFSPTTATKTKGGGGGGGGGGKTTGRK